MRHLRLAKLWRKRFLRLPGEAHVLRQMAKCTPLAVVVLVVVVVVVVAAAVVVMVVLVVV